MTNDIMIRLSNVKKKYRLGAIGGRMLKTDIQSWIAKKRGKEDPNLKIGVDANIIGTEFYALDGINLEIHKGERLGIIGANGAGKSTLLKILSQVTAPSEGEIDLYGRVSSMLEVGTGFHGEMTGRENIYMNGAILGMSTAEINERIEDIIDFSEVRDFIDTPVKRYSSGMFVKLAFAVAAHLNSEIMIMDEVLAVGDMAFQKKCLDKMREAADKEGRTVLYVSHNMNTIRNLCERVVVLDKGKIIFDGDTEDGIAVYMNHSLSENEVDIDLTTKSHIENKMKTILRMKHLSLIDKVTPTYELGEPIRIKILVDVIEPIKDALFRITLRTDSDMGLVTGFKEGINFDSTGETEIEIEVPISFIQKGIFYASVGFIYRDVIGRHITIDHITRAFKVEVLGKPTWNTTAYGFIKMDLK